MKLLVKCIRNRDYFIKNQQDLGEGIHNLLGFTAPAVTFIYPKSDSLVLNLFALSMTSSTFWIFSLEYYRNRSPHIPIQANSSFIPVLSKYVVYARLCLVAQFLTMTPSLPITETWRPRGIFEPLSSRTPNPFDCIIYLCPQPVQWVFIKHRVSGTWDTITKQIKSPPLANFTFWQG